MKSWLRMINSSIHSSQRKTGEPSKPLTKLRIHHTCPLVLFIHFRKSVLIKGYTSNWYKSLLEMKLECQTTRFRSRIQVKRVNFVKLLHTVRMYLFPSIHIRLQKVTHIIYKFLRNKSGKWCDNDISSISWSIMYQVCVSHHCIRREEIIFGFTNWQKEGDCVFKDSHLLQKWLTFKHTMV